MVRNAAAMSGFVKICLSGASRKSPISPVGMVPARPPLPTPLNFPFQSCLGIQTSIPIWDFDVGRVYLPEEDRRRFGYSDNDLKARRFTPQLDGDILRAGVPDDVGNRFLRHAETIRLDIGLELQTVHICDEAHSQSGALGLLIHQPTQGGH